VKRRLINNVTSLETEFCSALRLRAENDIWSLSPEFSQPPDAHQSYQTAAIEFHDTLSARVQTASTFKPKSISRKTGEDRLAADTAFDGVLDRLKWAAVTCIDNYDEDEIESSQGERGEGGCSTTTQNRPTTISASPSTRRCARGSSNFSRSRCGGGGFHGG
jgi:hypothetical protein